MVLELLLAMEIWLAWEGCVACVLSVRGICLVMRVVVHYSFRSSLFYYAIQVTQFLFYETKENGVILKIDVCLAALRKRVSSAWVKELN